MANQINEKSKKSYKQDSSTNAVKLLSKIDSFNGYIRVYTELNSNFKADDIVYISSKFNVKYTGFTLDNFIENNLDDYPYTDYANGYKVLRVKNNEIIIDRPYKFDEITTLKNHYISKISFNIGKFDKGELNSILFKQVEMSPINMNDVIFNQAIVLSGSVSDTLILDKYDFHYISKNTDIVSGQSPSITYSFNNTYGYSYFENIKFINCRFQNGYYNNCILTTPPADIVSNFDIENGYYDSCTISKHNINGGYMLDCDLDSFCVWNYGHWNNESSIDFGPSTWNDGVWIYGVFVGKRWVSGEFKMGLFNNSIWENGTFNGVAQDYHHYNPFVTNPSKLESIFMSSEWLNGIYNGGQFYNSEWVNGTFTNGYISESSWSGGTFDDGKLKNTTWLNGTFNGGLFGVDDDNFHTSIDSIWYKGHFNDGIFNAEWVDGYFNGGTIQSSTWATGIFTNGIFYKSTWIDGIWYNGTFNQSNWYGGTWNNGIMQDTDLDDFGLITSSNWYNGDWIDGLANNGNFHNVNWSGGTADGAQLGTSFDSIINWYDGSFNGTRFGYAELGRGSNSIPVEYIGGSSSSTVPNLKYVSGYITGATFYERIRIAQGHNLPIYTNVNSVKTYWENIEVNLISSTIMTFNGAIYKPGPKNDFSIRFDPIYTGFTGNWYGGSLYSGLFNGEWYDGHYYNSSWFGQDMITNDYKNPTEYANQSATYYQTHEEDFIQQNIDLPPDTNLFNPQNQGFQDPTYFD